MSLRFFTCVLAVSLLGLTGGVLADVPEYDSIQLQARSNFSSAYNLPDSAFFTNSTMALNDEGEVAFKVGVIGGTDSQGVWFGSDGVGQIEYTTPVGASMTDATLNNLGFVVWGMTFTNPDGIFFYDNDSDTSGMLTDQPIGATGWSSPEPNDNGEVGYRASFSGSNAYISYDGSLTPAFHAAEASLDINSPYSFLFTPSFNNQRQIAGKVRLGAPGQFGEDRPDQIRIFNADGSSVLIAEDRDSNSASPFTSFDNSVSLTANGLVAFTVRLSDNSRGVYISDGTNPIAIATTNDPEISDIEFFGPAANETGLVAFRAKDENGLRAIWVGDGTTLRRVVGEHDLVDTDLGLARIDEHTASNPVFGGGVSINANGDVAFAASLTPPDNNQIEWGSGAFVAIADAVLAGDCNGDGAVDLLDFDDFADCLAGPGGGILPGCECFDLDDDGDVTAGDFALLQASFVGE